MLQYVLHKQYFCPSIGRLNSKGYFMCHHSTAIWLGKLVWVAPLMRDHPRGNSAPFQNYLT